MKKKIVYVLYGILYFIAMLFVQEIASILGSGVSRLFSYGVIDPHRVFAPLFVHHIIQMIVALLIIAILKRKYKQNFGFEIGDKRKGITHVLIFSLVLTIFIIIQNVIAYSKTSYITYSFPLNARNIIGSLAFQMLMSGPSEEILFRALPITLFTIIFKKSIKIKWDISLEVVIAALLFAMAHIDGFNIDFQIYYSFVLGIIYGRTYQKTGSVIYPMLMHSISNVLAVGIGYLFYYFY